MKHRTALLLIALLCITCGHSFAAQPNILLIVGDDIGYGDLACYGGKDIATPNLDAIAAGGTRFTSGYVMAPVCGPSRAALLTGRYPSQILPYVGNPPHGSEVGLPKEHRLVSDYLHDAGYRTAALGKWHLGEQAGFEPQARGFDSFYGFLGGMHDNPLGQRLTALMISKRLADSAVPMSLLADHPNVQFNYFRGGLGSCAVEMH